MNADIHDWTGAYAAHSLSEPEAEEFRTHLEDCAQCREEVTAFEDVLAQMAGAEDSGADDAVDMPAGLQSSVMAAISNTPQEPAGRGPITTDAQGNTRVVSLERRRSERDQRAKRSWGSGRLLVAAAAVLAVAAVGVGTLLNLGGAERDSLEMLASVQAAEDAVALPMGVGDVQLHYSAAEGAYVAQGTAPELTDGETYQLWVVNSDGTIDAGPLFEPGDFVIGTRHDLGDAIAIAVSVEPEGGSEQPSTDPIAAVEF